MTGYSRGHPALRKAAAFWCSILMQLHLILFSTGNFVGPKPLLLSGLGPDPTLY